MLYINRGKGGAAWDLPRHVAGYCTAAFMSV